MSTTAIVIMFWALELTIIVGGLMLVRSFDNNYKMIIQTYKEMVTLINDYYTLEDRYSQIYDQFEECHRQLNDIRKFVESETLDVTLKLDTESLVQKKEDNENDDGRV